MYNKQSKQLSKYRKMYRSPDFLSIMLDDETTTTTISKALRLSSSHHITSNHDSF